MAIIFKNKLAMQNKEKEITIKMPAATRFFESGGVYHSRQIKPQIALKERLSIAMGNAHRR